MLPKSQIQSIVTKAAKGKRQAQRTLYSAYKAYLFGVANTYANTREEAEDILLEGFYRIFKDLKSYNSSGDLRAWMRKVVVNSALMYIRKHRKWEFQSDEESVKQLSQTEDIDFSSKERAQSILTLIRALPEPQRIIFTLKGIEGYSYKEIAVQLDIKENTLRSHYLRAKKKLQLAIVKEFE